MASNNSMKASSVFGLEAVIVSLSRDRVPAEPAEFWEQAPNSEWGKTLRPRADVQEFRKGWSIDGGEVLDQWTH